MIREMPSGIRMNSTRIKVPCTCGELFQGALNEVPCLVSCPIDIYSTAQLTNFSPGTYLDGEQKVAQALEWIARRTGQTVGVNINNSLPAGRGYGTSTADIGATLFAASQEFGLELKAAEASQIAVQIEPTDSTLFSGLRLFAHRTGHFQMSLGAAPPVQLIILDPGGMVDSESFNAQDWRKSLRKLKKEHLYAFQLLQQGIATGNLLAIGEAATLSAKCHQEILYNPLVDQSISFSRQLGALGICRAHSGTIVGLIFPIEYDCASAIRTLSHHLPSTIHIWQTQMIGGGPVYPISGTPKRNKI